MRLIVFAIIVLLVLIAWSASQHEAQNGGFPLVHADYQRCFTVIPGPLKPPASRLHGSGPVSEIA